eukprot:jgi/Antlo1/1386/1229
MKIRKVCGYREKNGQALFLVVWADRKTTWEYASNIHCAALVQRFYAKLVESISDIEKKQREAEAKLEEREIISRLRVLKKSNTELCMHTGTQSACNEEAKDSSHTHEKSIAIRSPTTDSKDEFKNRVFVQPLYFKRFHQAGGRRYFNMERHASPASIERIADKSRVFKYQMIPRNDSVVNVYKHSDTIFQQNGTRQISVTLSGVICANFGVKSLFQSFACDTKSFDCERLETCSAFYSMFFTLRQRSKRCFMNVHELDVVSHGDGLGKLYLLLSERRYVMVDNKEPEYTNFIIFNAKELLGYEITSKLALVQIKRRDFTDESLLYSRQIDCLGSQHLLVKDTATYYMFAEGLLLFNMHSLGLKSIFTFGMYTDNRNRLSKELRRNLVWYGGIETSLKEDSIDCVFVDRQYVQYLHVMPGVSAKIESLCVFYSYGFSGVIHGCSIEIKKILCSGGVFTFTKRILEAPDFPGLIEIFNLAKKERGKWMLRIPPLLLASFKAKLSELKGTLKYAGMLEIYGQLKNSIEDLSTQSIESYAYRLRQKYAVYKRFFYIVNDICHGDEIKTPVEVMRCIRRYL